MSSNQMRCSHNYFSTMRETHISSIISRYLHTSCCPSGGPRPRPGAVRIMFCRKDVLRTCQLRHPGCTGSSALLIRPAAPGPVAGSSLLLTVALTCKPSKVAGSQRQGASGSQQSACQVALSLTVTGQETES